MMTQSRSNAGGPTNFINQAGLKELLNYKYVSGQYSFGDTLMTPFWNWVVTLWPLWVAPNLITLLGLFANMIAVVIMLSYDTTFKEELPKWVNVLGAVALFVYQTFDAIDGKQARRTGTSGPLGQLFDHGCDAMTTTMGCLVLFQLRSKKAGGTSSN